MANRRNAKRKQDVASDDGKEVATKKARVDDDENQTVSTVASSSAQTLAPPPPPSAPELDSFMVNTSPLSVLVNATSTPNSSTVYQNDRMTVCLTCGMFVCGSHADVSYCFSEEHMCEGPVDISQVKQRFLKAISTMANAMYVDNNQNGDSGQLPFNQSNIKSALDQIFMEHQQVDNPSATNESIDQLTPESNEDDDVLPENQEADDDDVEAEISESQN